MKRRAIFTVLPACLLAAALVAFVVGIKLAPPGSGEQTSIYSRGQLIFEYPAIWKITEESNDPGFQQVMLLSPGFDYCILRRVRAEGDDQPPTLEGFAREFLDESSVVLRELDAEKPVHGFEHLSHREDGGLAGFFAPSEDHYLSKKIGRDWLFITYSHDAKPSPGIRRAIDLIVSSAELR